MVNRPQLFSLCMLLLAACGAVDSAEPILPWAAAPFPELSPPTSTEVAQAKLGRLLFYDPILSIDGETACATCHSEVWGMSDALALSIGNGGGLVSGPRREGPRLLRRNALAIWNLAFREHLFWDGRAESLEEQALQPLLEETELNREPDDVVVEMTSIEEYRLLFANAFPEDPRVSKENLASALANFERTLVSNRSLFDGYVNGDLGALGQDMVDGMFRFAEKGCANCHVPPLFESSLFANRNVPNVPGVEDLGRFEDTGLTEDRHKFRVPTLRNTAATEPYFHNGSVFLLEDAVEHELQQSGDYTEEDLHLITVFIGQALRDESRQPSRPKQVPSGLPVPIDGTSIAGPS